MLVPHPNGKSNIQMWWRSWLAWVSVKFSNYYYWIVAFWLSYYFVFSFSFLFQWGCWASNHPQKQSIFTYSLNFYSVRAFDIFAPNRWPRSDMNNKTHLKKNRRIFNWIASIHNCKCMIGSVPNSVHVASFLKRSLISTWCHFPRTSADAKTLKFYRYFLSFLLQSTEEENKNPHFIRLIIRFVRSSMQNWKNFYWNINFVLLFTIRRSHGHACTHTVTTGILFCSRAQRAKTEKKCMKKMCWNEFSTTVAAYTTN